MLQTHVMFCSLFLGCLLKAMARYLHGPHAAPSKCSLCCLKRHCKMTDPAVTASHCHPSLQVEAKMQMEQTVAEARLEQVYQHYKKKHSHPEGELVALTQKDRLRIDLLRAESDDKRDKKDRSPQGAVSRWVPGWIRGQNRRSSGTGERPSTSGATSHPSSRPPSAAGPSGNGGSGGGGSAAAAGGTVTYAALVAGQGSGSGSVSGRGEPATEAERRMAAREISADSKSLPRAASLQLPAPVNCQFRDRHPDMCVVRVRRNHLVEDAMDEISRQLKKDLFKPLRVHFIGEEGIDAGGVKKEFFQLLVTELLCPDYGLLVRPRLLVSRGYGSFL
jgi:hypothetical protein